MAEEDPAGKKNTDDDESTVAAALQKERSPTKLVSVPLGRLHVTMTTTTTISECVFNNPSPEAWLYAVTVHGACLLMGSLPLGTLLFVSRSWRTTLPISYYRILCVTVGVGTAAAVAVSVPNLLAAVDGGDGAPSYSWFGPFLASTFGFATFFKAINAGFDQFPPGADRDWMTWTLWFALMPEPQFTKGKRSKVTAKDMAQKLKSFLYKILALFILLSLLLQSPGYALQFHYAPEWVTTLINGFVHLWFIYIFAAFCLDFSSLMAMPIAGRLEPAFANPLLESRSLKQCWGEKWNMPIKTLLKRTVYIPARQQGWSSRTSAILTFCASGVLHEYNFNVHNRVAYQPGRATLFFVAMGLLMLSETWLWNQFPPFWQQRMDAISTPIVSAFGTLVAAWPFEKYFIQSWLDAGVVDAAAALLPHLTCSRR